ncbi:MULTISPECIES: hypothetical protein [Burkholderia cepacia complex]|uniref:Uncharacterized protein n=1 Tax=Burkholderia vietnamiensis TaxID=60552 RepID=A0AAW7T845_BURVI|nr:MULTISPECIES: hypothetical protein [Burkholderia cepacia complex]MBU9639576.1 hypothetical protein [Burkholderia multivorans]MDN7798332.1 hypothetical protein [Burkholderia vietnamiensis]
MEREKREHATAECPHCGFVGGKGHMQRYHMDNCKHKDAEVKPEPRERKPKKKGGAGRPRLEGVAAEKFKARILKEHAYKYLQEIGEYIADRGIDAIWDLKFGKPGAHYVLIDVRRAGFANQLERYVDSLVNKEKETAQKVG